MVGGQRMKHTKRNQRGGRMAKHTEWECHEWEIEYSLVRPKETTDTSQLNQSGKTRTKRLITGLFEAV